MQDVRRVEREAPLCQLLHRCEERPLFRLIAAHRNRRGSQRAGRHMRQRRKVSRTPPLVALLVLTAARKQVAFLSTARRRNELLVVKLRVLGTAGVTVVDNATSTGAIVFIAIIPASRIAVLDPACRREELEAADKGGVMAASLE